MTTLSDVLAERFLALRFEQIPDDVVQYSKLRFLDTLGLVLAAAPTEVGRAVRAGAMAWGGAGEYHLLGSGDTASLAVAALVNGALAHTTLFDDTLMESFIHVSAPILATGLAIGEQADLSGRELLASFVVGSEITCRVGLIAPGQVHRAGFHATGVYGAFGAAVTACRIMRLDARRTRDAMGVVGSMASGISQSWADGALTQTMHPGWAAAAGIAAANLAREGVTGPAEVLEGRFGLMRTHVQADGYAFDFERARAGIGEVWECRGISLKTYPNAHFLHAYLDALLALRRDGLRPEDVDTIICPMADYMIPIVCEPVVEKRAPAAAWTGRTSLPFSLAEAMVTGRLDSRSYSEQALANRDILEMAVRVRHVVDPEAPPKGRFKGHVIVETRAGRRLEHVELANRGSPQNPMSESDVIAKFIDNARASLPATRCEDIVTAVRALERLSSVRQLVKLCCQ
jgi:2-methylcitrate dehydratase PrpD